MGWNKLDCIFAKYRASIVLPNIPTGSTVLDFGCGEGTLLFKIRNNIRCGVGIDRKIRNINDSNISLLNADLERELSLQTEFFDVVISLAVLEHLNNPENAIKEIYRVLKKNGKLLLTTPTPRAKPLLEFLAFKLKIICREEIEDHKHYWDKNGLIKILKKAGFKEMDHKYFQLGFNQVVVAVK